MSKQFTRLLAVMLGFALVVSACGSDDDDAAAPAHQLRASRHKALLVVAIAGARAVAGAHQWHTDAALQDGQTS